MFLSLLIVDAVAAVVSALAVPLTLRQSTECAYSSVASHLANPVNIVSEAVSDLVWTPVNLTERGWSSIALAPSTEALWKVNTTGDRAQDDGRIFVSIVPFSSDGELDSIFATSSPRVDDIVSADNGQPVPVNSPSADAFKRYDWSVTCSTCDHGDVEQAHATGCVMEQGQTGLCATAIASSSATSGYKVILKSCDAADKNQSWRIVGEKREEDCESDGKGSQACATISALTALSRMCSDIASKLVIQTDRLRPSLLLATAALAGLRCDKAKSDCRRPGALAQRRSIASTFTSYRSSP